MDRSVHRDRGNRVRHRCRLGADLADLRHGAHGALGKAEQAYQRLAEESADVQRRIADQLEKATAELAELRQRTTALERVLREVE